MRRALPRLQNLTLQTRAFTTSRRAFAMDKKPDGAPDGKKILSYADKNGEFKRLPSVFRNFISKEPGAEFPPEKDRYHLYVSYACPWAHRVLIARQLKGLEDFIAYTSVHWSMLEKGISLVQA